MSLKVHAFEQSDPVRSFSGRQATYLHDYLVELGATVVVEETEYFDRDFLSEYSAFYATSTRPYTNRCRRFHFFSNIEASTDSLHWALSGDPAAQNYLQSCYLGFAVVRPIPAAPFGRTVLKWYEDRTPKTPRITASRTYTVHLSGVPLTVTGLAWQQQDSAVGACATIALWSLAHSSAYDEFHGIPTTAELTQFANRRAAFGARVFPSSGLTLHQILEAIKECGLAPVVLSGQRSEGGPFGFRPDVFSLYTGTLLRSGFPVILTGRHDNGGLHAICAVGFRDVAPAQNATVTFQDSSIRHIYAHDDNIGPNVRLRIDTGQNGEAQLVRDAPAPVFPHIPSPSRLDQYPSLRPENIVAAVPEALRNSPTELVQNAEGFAQLLRVACEAAGAGSISVTVGVRYSKVAEYQGPVLAAALGPGDSLAQVRLVFASQVPPLSLHIGVVRISISGRLAIDLVYDTSDNDRHLAPVCHVLFDASWVPLFRLIAQHLPMGVEVDASAA